MCDCVTLSTFCGFGVNFDVIHRALGEWGGVTSVESSLLLTPLTFPHNSPEVKTCPHLTDEK